ncbi:hypothetical protein [Streptomyces sp. NPDC003278]|uniref:hypothetical protein n=1 Tax=Streptomyces sp. NPDC003278 TaxID=3364679 RepID=UPI00367DD288
MARNIGADGRRVYRAVIVQTDQRRDGKSGTRYEGPYDSPGAARARVTFWRNYWDAYDDGSSATGHIEQAHTVWTPVDSEAEREQYKRDSDGRPTWASADVDGDRLLIAPAVFVAPDSAADPVAPGIYFRTDRNGSSIPLADLPALIARLQTIADTATAEAAAAEEPTQ